MNQVSLKSRYECMEILFDVWESVYDIASCIDCVKLKMSRTPLFHVCMYTVCAREAYAHPNASNISRNM
jgi:hypothetical protein